MARSVPLFVALSILTAPALAETPAGAMADLAADKQSDVNKIVCKREETIGTRLGTKKVCLTVQEWLDRERLSKDATGRLQQGAGIKPGN